MAFAAASLHAAQGDDDASPPARTIIITEIMYNPNSPEMVGETEWVEIVNVSEHTVEMSNWRLDDEDKKNWSPF
ncbi:MAG TPA: lamin tail domain-containing protein, partial [Phycisphaerales bacterium]|nr:lamin tail domain-containing protein [Phycisphaerales bacterium]